MRKFVAALAVLAVAGCAQNEEPEVAVVDPSDGLSPGCYTVDLFDPYHIQQPAPEVPEAARAFLGVWKNGAWDGHWCHDLYITAVHADGSVELLDAYGPWYDRGIDATVFKRSGRIEDGVLSFRTRYGNKVEYRMEGGYLVGQRSGSMGEMHVTMSREDGITMTSGGGVAPVRDDSVALVPIPQKRPIRRS